MKSVRFVFLFLDNTKINGRVNCSQKIVIAFPFIIPFSSKSPFILTIRSRSYNNDVAELSQLIFTEKLCTFTSNFSSFVHTIRVWCKSWIFNSIFCEQYGWYTTSLPNRFLIFSWLHVTARIPRHAQDSIEPVRFHSIIISIITFFCN